MENQFTKAMSKRTNEDLIKIVTIDRNGYQPAAIQAAEEEINKRGINTEKVAEVANVLSAALDDQNKIDTNGVSAMKRFLHCAVDTIAFLILTSTLLIVADLFVNTNDPTVLSLIGYSLYFISFFGYYIFMEFRFHKTFGKLITKTRVVTKSGQPPKLGDIVRRTFCRLIPLEALSYFFTSNGLHDSLSDTRVIKD